MKTINAAGFKISNVDQKALDHYLNITARTWAENALAGLINKSSKTILRYYFDLYKAQQVGDIVMDMSIIIPAIIAMPEFKPYNIDIPETPEIDRTEVADIEIWENGFDIEDWQEQALNAYYSNAQGYMNYLMTNKIKLRRDAFVKEHCQSMFKNKETAPANQDDFINYVCAKQEYKDRIQRDEELFA